MNQKSYFPLFFSLILSLMLLLAPRDGVATAFVCINSWLAVEDGAWTDATKWSSGTAPISTDDVCIDVAGTYTVTLNGNRSVNSVTLGNATGVQTLLVQGSNAGSTGSLTAATGFTNSGTVTMESIEAAHAVVLTITSGTFSMTGSGGAFNFTGGSILGNPLINLQRNALTLGALGTSPATFRMRATSTFTGNVSAGQTLLVQGAHAVVLTITSGTLENLPGAVFNVNQGAAGTRTLNLVLENSGTANFNTNTTFNKASAAHLNSGDFNIVSPSATVTFSGTGTSLTNQAAGTIAGIGTLNVSAITFTNAGTMSPDLSFGVLTLSGDFTQSASGVFAAEIGGRVAGTKYDQFIINEVSGAGTLDGTLDIQVEPGFVACVSDSFLVMTYLSHTGEFTTVTGGEIDATTFFDPVYGATGLTLEVISTVPSVPQVCIASPADGLVVNSGTSVTFQGIASDPEDGDLSASIVWTSNIQAGEFSGAGFTTGGLADGVHTITATVTDSNSNTSTDSITVTVSDTLPVLSIDGAADGSVFNSGSIVTLQRTATDAEDGDISEDIVWTSDLQVGSATGSSLSTDLLIDGVHTITATITDFLGNVVVDTITVTVSDTVPTVYPSPAPSTELPSPPGPAWTPPARPMTPRTAISAPPSSGLPISNPEALSPVPAFPRICFPMASMSSPPPSPTP